MMSEKLLARYQILLDLEEAGEVDAVTTLCKLWRYDSLNAHPNRLARIRQHITEFRSQILEDDFNIWLANPSNAGRWSLIMGFPDTDDFAFDSMLRNLVVDYFAQVHTLDTPYDEIFEYVKGRAQNA